MHIKSNGDIMKQCETISKKIKECEYWVEEKADKLEIMMIRIHFF